MLNGLFGGGDKEKDDSPKKDKNDD